MLVKLCGDNGQPQAEMVVNPKTFSTGSQGFFGTAKANIGGKNYQCQCQLVEIHSKPVAKTTPKGK